MIEDALAQYGVLGLWTLSLLAERYIYQKKTSILIENNTKALVQVYEVISKCQNVKRGKGRINKS